MSGPTHASGVSIGSRMTSTMFTFPVYLFGGVSMPGRLSANSSNPQPGLGMADTQGLHVDDLYRQIRLICDAGAAIVRARRNGAGTVRVPVIGSCVFELKRVLSTGGTP
jgi:hypothetical protein